MTNKLAQSLAYLRWNKMTPDEKRAATKNARAARAKNRKKKTPA